MNADELFTELRTLCKGRGINASDLDNKIGPRLREVAGDVTNVRDWLNREINEQVTRLPGDLRIAVLAAFGLLADTRDTIYFKERIEYLATLIQRDTRTALRRVDQGTRLLAEELVRASQLLSVSEAGGARGWYLQELRTVLRLDTANPEAHERRRIVATRDGLNEVAAWTYIPRGPGESQTGLLGEVHYGGRLIRRERPHSNRIQFVIQLPKPLRAGEPHEYELVARIPPGEAMRPRYVFIPEIRCNSFDLLVRFGLAASPTWIRVVHGEMPDMFDSPPTGADRVSLNDSGEVHVTFRRLVLYLGYGLAWQPR